MCCQVSKPVRCRRAMGVRCLVATLFKVVIETDTGTKTETDIETLIDADIENETGIDTRPTPSPLHEHSKAFISVRKPLVFLRWRFPSQSGDGALPAKAVVLGTYHDLLQGLLIMRLILIVLGKGGCVA